MSISFGDASFFNVESYNLPSDQGRRHTTGIYFDNKLYVAGGLSEFGPSSPNFEARRNVYSLDLDSNNPEWVFLNDIPSDTMSQPWFTSTRGLLEIGNNIYLACHDSRDSKIYSFDDKDGRFTEISEIPTDSLSKTEDCCAVGITVKIKDETQFPPKTIHDDRIYITGGVQPTGNDPSDQVIYYSINEDKWYQVDSLNTARSHHACTAVPDKTDGDKIYVIGGAHRTNLEIKTSIEVYNILDNEWIQYDNVINPGRRSFGAITISEDDAIVLIGGDSRSAGDPQGADPLNIVQILDTNTNAIINNLNVPQLNFARVSPATTVVKIDCDNNYNVNDHCYSIFVIAGFGKNGVLRTDTETWHLLNDWRSFLLPNNIYTAKSCSASY